MLAFFRVSFFSIVVAMLISSGSSVLAHEYKVKIIPQDSKEHFLFRNNLAGTVYIHVCLIALDNIDAHVRLTYHGSKTRNLHINTSAVDNPCEIIPIQGSIMITAATLHGTPNNKDGVATIKYRVSLD